MSEHYTKNTTAVSRWCTTCKKITMHRVDFKRVGTCTEHVPSGLSKKQEQAQRRKEEAENAPTFDF